MGFCLLPGVLDSASLVHSTAFFLVLLHEQHGKCVKWTVDGILSYDLMISMLLYHIQSTGC